MTVWLAWPMAFFNPYVCTSRATSIPQRVMATMPTVMSNPGASKNVIVESNHVLLVDDPSFFFFLPISGGFEVVNKLVGSPCPPPSSPSMLSK